LCKRRVAPAAFLIMAYETWNDAFAFFKRQIPDVFIKRKFNFITIHYIYIMGMSIFLSIIIYGIGRGEVPYIDALFFGSGSSTQSGLNTIDINELRTGQQAMLFLGAMVCNPIVIHSAVVFVRLYMFEKRFKDIVTDARALRRTKSKTRTMHPDPEANPDLSVRGRAIQILRDTGRRLQKHESEPNMEPVKDTDSSNHDLKERADTEPSEKHELARAHSDDDLRLPQQIDPEQHIRFLEAQRKPQDGNALRIPSPREFDRGGRPENVLELGPPVRRLTSNFDEQNPDPPHYLGRHITINEPDIHHPHNNKPIPRATSRQKTQTSDLEPKPHQFQKRPKRSNTFSSFRRTNTARSVEGTPYLSYQPTIGRNSFFVNLTEEQREELGGIEYRALKTLALVLVMYFFCFHILGWLCLVPWILQTRKYGNVVRDIGQGRTWWGFFTAASMFNDLGFTLTPDSMISFQNAVFPLLIGTFLIIIGNTGFPCMLRFVIWCVSKLVPENSAVWEELRFLLDHPRRCFTLLFPSGATWWLLGILVILNGMDLIFFIVLDLNDPAVTHLPGGLRFLDGLFQAASTRTAGFAVVNLAELHPAIQVSYLVMMYISVFPIAISMRRTNVYEEKSLGIYAPPGENGEDPKEPSYVGAHLRKQLSFDLWFIFLGLFIIAIVEGHRLENTNEYAFTLFSVLFEIVSAYGTVGLSLGYPTINASFSAEFKVISKLVIIAMQVRGRHRGLPYELDRAVLLPSEKLQANEAGEAQRIMQRRRSSVGAMSAVDGQVEGRFRSETGLTTGSKHSNLSNPEGKLAARHKSHARHGLGTAMFKLASATNPIQDERGGQSSTSTER
jgi:Trk-type K+ transport system membrane component